MFIDIITRLKSNTNTIEQAVNDDSDKQTSTIERRLNSYILLVNRIIVEQYESESIIDELLVSNIPDDSSKLTPFTKEQIQPILKQSGSIKLHLPSIKTSLIALIGGIIFFKFKSIASEALNLVFNSSIRLVNTFFSLLQGIFNSVLKSAEYALKTISNILPFKQGKQISSTALSSIEKDRIKFNSTLKTTELSIDTSISKFNGRTQQQLSKMEPLPELLGSTILPSAQADTLTPAQAVSELQNQEPSLVGVSTIFGSNITIPSVNFGLGEVAGRALSNGAKYQAPLESVSVIGGSVGKLLDFISASEGTDYNTQSSYINTTGGKPLQDFTIKQIFEIQNGMIAAGALSTAIGRYQFIQSTLESLVVSAGLDPNTTYFTPALQDKLALIDLKRRGLNSWLAGKESTTEFARSLSQEWASLANPDTGTGFYTGQNARYSLTSFMEVLSEIQPIEATTQVVAFNTNKPILQQTTQQTSPSLSDIQGTSGRINTNIQSTTGNLRGSL